MKIADWMKTELVTVAGETTIEEAINLLVEKRVGTLPVVAADGRLLGLVTMKRILKQFLPDFFDLKMNIDHIEDFGAMELPSRERQALMSRQVAGVMERNPVTVSTECTVFSAVNIMSRHNIYDLLIADKGFLKGLVSTVDLGVAFLHWIKSSAELSEKESSSPQDDD
ncbi:MAG: CBS domain-containing protein [Candidatus Eremiobacteraeota bacterium]|nr:CBS domain-containing protein [Candidatus Eremiobacteraeota bacterium]